MRSSSISRGTLDLSDKKKALFKHLQQEAAVRLAQREKAVVSQPGISRRPDLSSYPLSLFQEHFWWLEQLMPGNPSLRVTCALQLTGPLDATLLDQALHMLMQRHEILRAVFVQTQGTPEQLIQPALSVHLSARDLTNLESGDTPLPAPDEPHTFDLARGPLLNVALMRLSGDEHILVCSAHALLADYPSLVLLCQELMMLYSQLAQGQPAALPACALCYADYAAWQLHYLQGASLNTQQAYWRQHLADATLRLNLPVDGQRPATRTPGQAHSTLELDPGLVQQARDFCAREESTLEELLFTIFALLLSQYTGQTDILPGFCSTQRLPDLASLVGTFAHLLPVRVQFAEDLTDLALLRQVRQTLCALTDHRELPLEHIVAALYPGHDLTRVPFVQTSLAVYHHPSCQDLPAGLSARYLPLAPSLALQDLSLQFHESEQSLYLTVAYKRDLFSADRITRFQQHYCQLLQFFLQQPGIPLSSLSCLTPEEQTCQLRDWNSAHLDQLPAPGQCIHHLFEQQVQRTPQAVALSTGDQQLTYEQLNSRANRLARFLQCRGIGPEKLVGLCLPRSLELVIGLLAILKTGAAYVPLDPAYPRERLAFTVQDAQLALLLTTSEFVSQLAMPTEISLCVDVPGLACEESPANLAYAMSSEHLAYVIYTSGSTGQPKGVCISHRSAVIFLTWARQHFSDEELAGVLFGTSICFDLSIFELFAPLSWGGKVILAPTVLDLPLLAAQERITLLNTVPSAVAALLANTTLPASLCTINLAGEALTRDLVQALYQQPGVQRVCNLYGPTEDTTYSTWLTLDPQEQGAVPIGCPLENTRAYIVDSSFQLVPPGVVGELYLGGDGQARGYLNRPDLTAERFIPDPFSSQPGRRLYKTGDLARYRFDGVIEYMGRIDHQVKIRGFRIELGEIEAQLRQHPTVTDAVVVAWSEQGREKRLVAYVVARPSHNPDPLLLRQHLLDRLPAYMLPAFFVVLDELPRTTNGKVDRKALPAPDPVKISIGSSPGELPQGKREQWLALLWQEILQLPAIGREDNFFASGGDSLRAMQLLARLRRDLRIHLSLADFFAVPTIAQLAEKLRDSTFQPDSAPVVPDRLPEPALAFGQQRLWFADQLEVGTALFNVPLILALHGSLNRLALYQALYELVHRHQSLRMTIRVTRGRPYPHIDERVTPALTMVDLQLSAQHETSLTAELWKCPAVLSEIRAEVQRPFDLATGPLLRVRLLRVSWDCHILMLTMHHIIVDGWSLNLLTRELNLLYNAFLADRPSPLPEPSLHYEDYIAWQRVHQAPTFPAALAYWRERLTPLPSPLNLLADHPRPPVRTFSGAHCHFQIPQALTQQVVALSQREGTTLFMTLLTAFLVLLSRSSGQEDLVVGTPVANRPRPELESLVGLFMNILALRMDLSGNPTGRELLQRVRATTLGAYDHQEVPFEQVINAVQPPRDPARSPLFQVLFVLQNTPAVPLELEGLSTRCIEVLPPHSEYDLSFVLEEHAQGLKLTIEYNTSLFEQTTIERLHSCYLCLLRDLCTQPATSIHELALLTDDERTRIVRAWNHPATAFPADERVLPGQPLANGRTYILDAALQPVPIGIYGDLYLAGEGLTRGYPGLSELTAEHFLPDPFTEQPGACMYRTGDKAYYRVDGEIVYAGQIDKQAQLHGEPQVKLRGSLPSPASFQRTEQDVPSLDNPLQGPVEEALAKIWQKALGAVGVERTENFFEIGGHSLLAMQVLAVVHEELHVSLTIREFFAAPVLADLARLIEYKLLQECGAEMESQETVPALVPVERTEALPLSFAQQRLWFLDQLEGKSATYTIPVVLQLTGSLDIAVFRQSLRELVRRHEVLRTTFVKAREMPVQCVHLLPAVALQVTEMAPGDLARDQDTLLQHIRAEVQRPFDLAAGPLLRLHLFRLDARKHILVLTMHHIVSDGWSLSIMARELSVLYNAFLAGHPSPLSELSIQYADFAVWQRAYLQGPRLDEHLAYWKQHLQGTPSLRLPTDHPRQVSAIPPGAVTSQQWSRTLTQQLLAFSQREEVTLFMTLVAGFIALLAYLSGQEDVTIGTPIANRPHPELEQLVGLFVNTLALRVDLSGNPTARELLRRVREVTLNAYEHQDVPFEQVVEAVQPKREQGRSPLFQVLLVFQSTPASDLTLDNLEVEAFGTHTSTAKFDLSVGLEMHDERLEVGTEYNSQLFERATIQQFHTRYRALLEQFTQHPEWRLSELYRTLSELS